jgi:hypothetical protein
MCAAGLAYRAAFPEHGQIWMIPAVVAFVAAPIFAGRGVVRLVDPFPRRYRLARDVFARLRKRQRAEGRLDAVARKANAIWLHTAEGRSYYLTRWGRVISVGVVLGGRVEEASAVEAASALFRGGEVLAAPELWALMPQTPPDGAGSS